MRPQNKSTERLLKENLLVMGERSETYLIISKMEQSINGNNIPGYETLCNNSVNYNKCNNNEDDNSLKNNCNTIRKVYLSEDSSRCATYRYRPRLMLLLCMGAILCLVDQVTIAHARFTLNNENTNDPEDLPSSHVSSGHENHLHHQSGYSIWSSKEQEVIKRRILDGLGMESVPPKHIVSIPMTTC